MWTNFVSKVSLFVMMIAPCVGLPIVNAEGVPLNWTSPTRARLNSVFMVNSDDGWAVGKRGTTIHWNGTEWSNVTSPTKRNLKSVFMVSSSDGWAVGEWGRIIHWDGTEWSNVTPHLFGYYLSSVFMVNSNDGWAVGWWEGWGEEYSIGTELNGAM